LRDIFFPPKFDKEFKKLYRKTCFGLQKFACFVWNIVIFVSNNSTVNISLCNAKQHKRKQRKVTLSKTKQSRGKQSQAEHQNKKPRKAE
jgi:hypothetical protein